MLLLLTEEVLFGTDYCTTKKQLQTSPRRSSLIRKMLSTGTIELVVIETREGKYFCLILTLLRFEEALFDFDKAITLEASNPVIYSNRGLVNRKMERFAAAINDYSNEINFSQSTNL
jgi:tetratricopeptide (TPR) repeat protein